MMIMSVLAVSLAPLASGTGASLAVEAAAEQLARELQAVRQQAVTQGKTYEVRFVREGGYYLIREAKATAVARRIDLPPGVYWVQFPFELLTFYATGRCSLSGTVILGHEASNLQIQVIITANTGRVQVKRGNK
jgi:type II secretory pathway pseudopilin PulG